MKVEYYVRTESTLGEIDVDIDGKLGVDFDREDLAQAIQDQLLEMSDIDIDSGETPENMEMTYGQVFVL